jgi:hypothetical protein
MRLFKKLLRIFWAHSTNPPHPTTDVTPLNHGGMIGGWVGRWGGLVERFGSVSFRKQAQKTYTDKPSHRVAQPQNLPGLLPGGNRALVFLADFGGALHQRRVRWRQGVAVDPHVVFQPCPGVAPRRD